MATGVRRVFLGMQAYAAGVYIDQTDLDANKLEERIDLGWNASYIIRIVPVRSTSLIHIRDALGKNLIRQIPNLSEPEQKLAKQELKEFLGCFPNAKLEMGEELLICKDTINGLMQVCRSKHEPKSIKSEQIGPLLLRFYLDPNYTSIPEHYALQDTGVKYEMVAAYDINMVANDVYRHNFGLVPKSVNLEHLSIDHFVTLAADCWLLSPPCQPYTRGGKLLDDEDLRAVGLLHLITILREMPNPPRYIFLENVLNFEKSRTRERLIQVLATRGYHVEEFLISPNDPWVGIPNDRLRYYLGAERVQTELAALKDDRIINKLSEVLGPAPTHEIYPIGKYLRPEGDDPRYKVPTRYITDYKDYRHDVANPEGTRSTTFTKAYGSNYIIGTGSFLQTKRLDLKFEPDDQQALLTLGLRFFAPMEIALLHALPVADSPLTHTNLQYKFSFPSQTTILQQYRLLGNSLNVLVVSRILTHLFQINRALG